MGPRGRRVAIVQSRPITALPEPAADPPTDWSVPDPTAFYVRASIVEQLPDPLTPLFADLVDGSVDPVAAGLLGRAPRRQLLRAGDLGLPTINGYAYYRYTPRGMARITLRITPAALPAPPGDPRARAATRWRDQSHPRYARVVDGWTATAAGRADRPPSCWTASVELLDAGTEYYTSVQTIIPMAASSE